MTAALPDRLTHKARILNCSWPSYRLKQSLDGIDRNEEENKNNRMIQ